VGLVGAAVTDHPKIAEVVAGLANQGLEVGLSSMRADRLGANLVDALCESGMKTLTIASDGLSERQRASLEKKIQASHLLGAADLCAERNLRRLKVYVMVGVEGERDADYDEFVDLCQQMAKRLGGSRLVLGVSPFVPKHNTPLAATAFAGIKTCERRIATLRGRLGGVAEVKPASARWAWVEAKLSMGTSSEGRAVLDALQQGGSFSAWKKALTACDEQDTRRL